jgi:DtxR family Mn-dependent transcriptional regulator
VAVGSAILTGRIAVISSTVENYLKQIYLAEQAGDPAAPVSTGALAAALHVTPGSATAMVQALAESGLVSYEPRRGARLTEEGRRLALRVVRRHRLVELFLVETLGMDWSEVHAEAELLEHAISDAVLERIDRLLGHPSTDPHGDAIPSAAGRVPRRDLRSLADCEPGAPFEIARVGNQDPDFLRFANEHGLRPGRVLRVEGHDRTADTVTIRLGAGAPLVVGSTAARRIFVQSPPSAARYDDRHGDHDERHPRARRPDRR